MARRNPNRSRTSQSQARNETQPHPQGVIQTRAGTAMAVILCLTLAGLGFSLVVVFGANNRTAEPAVQEPVEPPSNFDEIQSVYLERYAELVTRINDDPFDVQSVENDLEGLIQNYDSNHDRIFQGLLLAWLQEPERAAARLTMAVEGQPLSPVDPLVANRYQTLRFERDDLFGPTFTTYDCHYLWHCYVFQRLANRIVMGCRNDREKADRILDWVYRHVLFDEPTIFNLRPFDIVLRGYGLCDRSVWVFTLLAARAGLVTGIAMIGAPDPVDSKHTVCLVRIDDQWLVCDTTLGVFVRIKEMDATILEIVQEAERQKTSSNPDPYFAPFALTTIAIGFNANGIPPRFTLLDPYFCIMLTYGKVSVSLTRLQQDLITLVPDRVRNRTWRPTVWGFPFNMRADGRDPDYHESWKNYFAPVLQCQPARLNQLFGYPRAAAAIYEQLESVIQTKWKERCCFLRAQSFFDGGDMKQAEAVFIDFLRRYPNARWKSMGILHLARCKVALGDIENAEKLYQTIHDLEIVRRDLEHIKHPH